MDTINLNEKKSAVKYLIKVNYTVLKVDINFRCACYKILSFINVLVRLKLHCNGL